MYFRRFRGTCVHAGSRRSPRPPCGQPCNLYDPPPPPLICAREHILWKYRYLNIIFANLGEHLCTWILAPPPDPLVDNRVIFTTPPQICPRGHILWKYRYLNIIFANLVERVCTGILAPPPPNSPNMSTWTFQRNSTENFCTFIRRIC